MCEINVLNDFKNFIIYSVIFEAMKEGFFYNFLRNLHAHDCAWYIACVGRFEKNPYLQLPFLIFFFFHGDRAELMI